MYMYGNTESALTTESLDGYLPNLVGIKYSWPRAFVLTSGPNPPGAIQGRAIIGQWEALLQRTSFFRVGRLQQQTKCIAIGIFESPKCDVNPQPNTRGIGPLVGRTSGYRCSVMHVLGVILSLSCHFFFICQNIFVRVIWSGREKCPLLLYPSIFLVF